jgi:hypothetical protein
MHWRRFKISEIPINSSKAFDVWLRNRWREKDYMLEYFFRHGRFPAEAYWKNQLAEASSDKASSVSFRSVARPARTIETEVKSGKFEEFLKIFAPITALAMALFLAYGASPEDLPFPNGGEFLQQHLGTLVGNMSLPTSEGAIEKMLEAGPRIPTEPKNISLGNTPEDRAKQQKYLKLFKDSLPPEISLEAEQRRRVHSFLNSLPSKEEAQRAAIAGAKAPFAERRARKRLEPPKASTATGKPSQAQSRPEPALQKAHSVHKGVEAHQKASNPSSTKPEAKYTVVNGVRIKILSPKKEDSSGQESKGNAKVVETKNGMRIKQPAGQTALSRPSTSKQTSEQARNYLETKSGVKIKQPTPSIRTSQSNPKGSSSTAASVARSSAKTEGPTTKPSPTKHLIGSSGVNRSGIRGSDVGSKAAVKQPTITRGMERNSDKQAKTASQPISVLTSSGPRKLQS